jgi:hypothetical protein
VYPLSLRRGNKKLVVKGGQDDVMVIWDSSETPNDEEFGFGLTVINSDYMPKSEKKVSFKN